MMHTPHQSTHDTINAHHKYTLLNIRSPHSVNQHDLPTHPINIRSYQHITPNHNLTTPRLSLLTPPLPPLTIVLSSHSPSRAAMSNHQSINRRSVRALSIAQEAASSSDGQGPPRGSLDMGQAISGSYYSSQKLNSLYSQTGSQNAAAAAHAEDIDPQQEVLTGRS